MGVRKGFPRYMIATLLAMLIAGAAWLTAHVGSQLVRRPAVVEKVVTKNGVAVFAAQGTPAGQEQLVFIAFFVAAFLLIFAIVETLFRRRFGVSLLDLYFDR